MTSIADAAASLANRGAAAEFQYLNPAAIIPSKTNPRKTFDPAYIADLARSMKEVGVLEPILVRPRGEGTFELIAGECRWRAATLAELDVIPVRIRPLTDQEVLEVQVIENLQRRDLSPLEEAEGYRQLLATKKYDAARIAERIGMSAKYVYDRIKLGDLVDEAKEHLRAQRIDAGHGILLARLKPEDQKRALKEHGAVFTDEAQLWDPTEGSRYSHVGKTLKARTVRELDGWINEHVRFERTRDADPMLFPETALQLKEAQESNTKVVAITYNHFTQEEARDDKERTIGPQSWKRADGKAKSKPCEHSVLGVIAAGPNRGEAFDICIAKEKCKTHWGAWQRERETNKASGYSRPGGVEKAKQESAWKREQQRQDAQRAREDAERARWKKAAPKILEAIADKVKKMPTSPGGLLGQLLIGDACGRQGNQVAHAVADFIPRGSSTEDLVRFLAFIALYQEATDHWSAPREFPKRAKAFGVDAAKILKEVAPDTPVPRCSECGCTEDKACPGGCGWAKSPDAKTGLGVCTKCVKPAKKAAKRAPAQARA